MNKNCKILIGTHHKTGTAWMSSIFERIADEYKLQFFTNNFEKHLKDKQWNILLNDHSQFNLSLYNKFLYKGIHIIRDPRDIIVSGTFYHCKSKEKWLHKKKREYNGLTYQEKINSYSLIDDKMMFEMENSAIENLNHIANWNYDNNNFLEVKYEHLIADIDLILFHKIYTFLGFTGKEITQCLDISYQNSMFSGEVKKSVHVRSGKSKQWKLYFKPRHKKRFLELYGDLLINLGYELNNDWGC